MIFYLEKKKIGNWLYFLKSSLIQELWYNAVLFSLQSLQEQACEQKQLYERYSKEQDATRERLYSTNNQQKQEIQQLQQDLESCAKKAEEYQAGLTARDVTIEDNKVGLFAIYTTSLKTYLLLFVRFSSLRYRLQNSDFSESSSH